MVMKSSNLKMFGNQAYRVQDETKRLVDSVLTLDTNKVVCAMGTLKIAWASGLTLLLLIVILVAPLFGLAILLISITDTEIYSKEVKANILANLNTSSPAQSMGKAAITTDMRMVRNESIAPGLTGIMLVLSAATDFILIWHRRGTTIVLHSLTSTVTFVASILCVEYDRLQITSRCQRDQNFQVTFRYQLYLASVVLSSISVTVALVSILIGSRVAALEESRLYMEREGKIAILQKTESFKWHAVFEWVTKWINRKKRNGKSKEPGSDTTSQSSNKQLFDEETTVSTKPAFVPTV